MFHHTGNGRRSYEPDGGNVKDRECEFRHSYPCCFNHRGRIYVTCYQTNNVPDNNPCDNRQKPQKTLDIQVYNSNCSKNDQRYRPVLARASNCDRRQVQPYYHNDRSCDYRRKYPLHELRAEKMNENSESDVK